MPHNVGKIEECLLEWSIVNTPARRHEGLRLLRTATNKGFKRLRSDDVSVRAWCETFTQSGDASAAPLSRQVVEIVRWLHDFWMFRAVPVGEVQDCLSELQILTFRKDDMILYPKLKTDACLYIVYEGQSESTVVEHGHSKHVRFYGPGDCIPAGSNISETVNARSNGVLFGLVPHTRAHKAAEEAVRRAREGLIAGREGPSERGQWHRDSVLEITFKSYDKDMDGCLTKEEFRAFLRGIGYEFSDLKYGTGMDQANLCKKGGVVPLRRFLAWWREADFEDPFKMHKSKEEEVQEEEEGGEEGVDEELDERERRRRMGYEEDEPEVGDQANWKLDEDEELTIETAQSAEDMRVVMRGYGIAEGNEDHVLHRPIDSIDIRMFLLDMGWKGSIQEVIDEVLGDAQGGIAEPEAFVYWYVQDVHRKNQKNKAKKKPPPPSTASLGRRLSDVAKKGQNPQTRRRSMAMASVRRLAAGGGETEKKRSERLQEEEAERAEMQNKRHAFIELPEVMLADFWQHMTACQGPIAGPRRKIDRIIMSEFLNALHKNAPIAQSLMATTSSESDDIDREKATQAFEGMAAGRREISFDDFLHYYGPRGRIRHN